MSIEPSYDPYEGYMFFAELVGTPCFFCSAPLTAPFVAWRGAAPDMLALHPGCVLDLTMRLMRDVWELECKTELRVTLTPALPTERRVNGA